MVINTNTTAQKSAHNLMASQAQLSKSLARLSSGSKIVNPSDDAAGVAVGMRLDAQVKRLDAALNNVGNAVSFTQTQDGYLKKVGKALDRMSELSLLAQDVTKSDADRSLYNNEFTQLSAYISEASSKDFNGVSLFSSAALNVTSDSEGDTLSMTGVNLANAAYTTALAGNISTNAGAVTALTNVKAAIVQLSSDRASVGAYQSRLNYTSEQLTISKENLTAASSRIQDVDVAEEATNFAKQNILVQSGTAMLAQANQLPQSVLRLLQ
ncbi:MAG TPA: flagellin [Candidatus Limnocylindria bacterium]|nr:flagellin [Candidatus Limnocylindria bacterium]